MYPSMQARAACENSFRKGDTSRKLLTDFLVLINPIIRQQNISYRQISLKTFAEAKANKVKKQPKKLYKKP